MIVGENWTSSTASSFLDGSVEFTESLEEKGLLFVVSEGQSLDGLSGVLGSLGDSNEGVSVLSVVPFILDNLRSVFAGSVSGFVSNLEDEISVASLLGLRLRLDGVELESRSECGLVVESGKGGLVEAFVS